MITHHGRATSIRNSVNVPPLIPGLATALHLRLTHAFLEGSVESGTGRYCLFFRAYILDKAREHGWWRSIGIYQEATPREGIRMPVLTGHSKTAGRLGDKIPSLPDSGSCVPLGGGSHRGCPHWL